MRLVGFLAGFILLYGCTYTNLDNTPGIPVTDIPVSQSSRNRGTGPEARDIATLADKMMRSLLRANAVVAAPHAPTAALLPFENNTRFPIQSDIFINKLRVELNTKAGGRILFLARGRIHEVLAERDLKRMDGFTSNPNLTQLGPAGSDYFLTGTMTGLSEAGPAGRQDYILYQCQLIDAESSVIVWEDQFESNRFGRNNVIYR